MEGNISTVSIKTCIGKEVFDNSGNRCGNIQDFLFDHQGLSVPFFVLSEGGSFNPAVEENYFVLPLQTLHLENPEAESLTLNIAAKKLRGVPKISKTKFIKGDGDFLKEIEDFYGVKENFARTHSTFENESEDHQGHEGSAENSENESVDYNKLGDEANYDHIKGIDRKENL